MRPHYNDSASRLPGEMQLDMLLSSENPGKMMTTLQLPDSLVSVTWLQQQLEHEQQAAVAHGGLYELEGKITIALSRYLHTYVDLVLRRPRLSIDPVLSNPVQEKYLATHAADTRILNNHQLKEHRRMRSKNLHYLDSPEFAMLILIHRYEAAEVEAVATELEEPLPDETVVIE